VPIDLATIFTTKVRHTSLGQVVYHDPEGPAGLRAKSASASSYEWSRCIPELPRASGDRIDLIGFGESARRLR